MMTKMYLSIAVLSTAPPSSRKKSGKSVPPPRREMRRGVWMMIMGISYRIGEQGAGSRQQGSTNCGSVSADSVTCPTPAACSLLPAPAPRLHQLVLPEIGHSTGQAIG